MEHLQTLTNITFSECAKKCYNFVSYLAIVVAYIVRYAALLTLALS